MIEIGLVEIRKCHKAVKIVYCDFTTLEGDQTIFAQLARHPVDVNRTQPQRDLIAAIIQGLRDMVLTGC